MRLPYDTFESIQFNHLKTIKTIMNKTFFIIFTFILSASSVLGQNFDIKVVAEINLGTSIGQFRAAPVDMGENNPKAIAALFSEDAEIDPWIGMFFFPKNTLKLILFDETGKILWERDLGDGVVPGIWFSPLFAFDLDNDGIDEIWIINNTDPEHPLDHRRYVLEKVNALTGETEGQWPWPQPEQPQTMSALYRHFIMGGYVNDTPVLLTAQGTYGPMAIQAWNADMSQRWEHKISTDEKGCQGSHVTPVVDINQDGIDDLLWGERCIELDKGTQLFCADEDTWEGHSDIIQPVFNYQKDEWGFFTCRESANNQAPRVAFYNNQGERVWGKLDEGHIDTGWAARLSKNGEPVVLGVKV